MSSFIKRMFARVWRQGVTYKASNSFYEYPTPFGDASLRKTRRVVKYASSNGDVWDQISAAKRLPVQWQAWLSHTRVDPPSLDELQYDVARIKRLQINIARLHARDQELRVLEAAGMRNVDVQQVTAPKPSTNQQPTLNGSSSPAHRTNLPSPPDIQTESWVPRLGRQRQS